MDNTFDNKIREALEQFEMPYDPEAWAQLEQQLPQSPVSGNTVTSSGLWKTAALFTMVALTAALVWFVMKNEAPQHDRQTMMEQTAPKTSTNTSAQEPQQAEEGGPTKERNISAAPSITHPTQKAGPVRAQESVPPAEKNRPQPSHQPVVQEEHRLPSEQTPKDEQLPGSPMDGVPDAVRIDFIASTTTVCAGDEVHFMNRSEAEGNTLTWDFGDGTISTEPDPTHVYAMPGVYEVALSAENGKAKTVVVKVNPAPSPIMTVKREIEDADAIPLYRFNTATLPSETAVWNITNGPVLQGNSVKYLFRNAGEHPVTLTVSNSMGCSTSVSSTVNTEDFNLLAPSAFTPNGDGRNETFIPEALNIMQVAFELSIQDPRTGETVYRTQNALEPWNGKQNNSGRILEPGVYVWTVILHDNIVDNKVFVGKINLQP